MYLEEIDKHLLQEKELLKSDGNINFQKARAHNFSNGNKVFALCFYENGKHRLTRDGVKWLGFEEKKSTISELLDQLTIAQTTLGIAEVEKLMAEFIAQLEKSCKEYRNKPEIRAIALKEQLIRNVQNQINIWQHKNFEQIKEFIIWTLTIPQYKGFEILLIPEYPNLDKFIQEHFFS